MRGVTDRSKEASMRRVLAGTALLLMATATAAYAAAPEAAADAVAQCCAFMTAFVNGCCPC